MRLREVELAERLQVSRTPVREALRRLESDGFVERAPAGGLVATPTGPDDLGDIGLLRIEVDGLAARLAATRGTEADWAQVFFLVSQLRTAADDAELAHAPPAVPPRDLRHRASARAWPRSSTASCSPTSRRRSTSGPGKDSDPEGAFRQHLTLVRALSSGDAERAAAAARDHAASGLRYAKSTSEIAGHRRARPG